jgi:hypothetical protein
MVTPPEKDSGEPKAIPFGLRENNPGEPIPGAHAAEDGDRMAWFSENPLPGSRASTLNYLSTRGAAGWSSENVVPPLSASYGLTCEAFQGPQAYSSDLARSVLALPGGPARGFKEEEECGHDEPRLVAGEPNAFQNLFLRDSSGVSYSLVNVTPAGVTLPEAEENLQQYSPAAFLAGSNDLSHVVFEEELALTPDAPLGYRGGDELYEWTNGEVRLVSILPGAPGAAVPNGRLAGATRNNIRPKAFEPGIPFNIAYYRNAVSADGSRIFFEVEGNLYVREDGVRTVQIDASQGAGSGGGGKFEIASADGSVVYFTADASAALTPDTVPGSGKNLYRFVLEGESGELTDLTPAAEAGVLGVSGASESGSYLYFVAEGALAANSNSHGDTAIAGEPNLYLSRAGETIFVATLDAAADYCDWISDTGCPEDHNLLAPGESGLTARVAANGLFAGFNSVRSLTGYDNTDVNTGEPDREIYLYDAASNTLICPSCNPTGVPPTAGAEIRWPSPNSRTVTWRMAYPQRNVSDRGQVFFDTTEALLPRDGNGQRDVYEFSGGSLQLVSTGASEAGSWFLDATPSGSDVYFGTAQTLLPRDIDATFDYYDARVNGGFPEPPAPPPPCAGEGCKGQATGSPAPPSPGSVGFVGSGNARQHRHCSHFGHRAKKLSHRAKRLRRNAGRVSGERRAHHMRRKATRLSKRARHQRGKGKSCRRRVKREAAQ